AGTVQGGQTLLLDATVGGAPCDLVTGVDVAETATAVRITVFSGVPATARAQQCTGGLPAIAGTERVEVRLHRPLGARGVVHGTG
ncbi:MAG TPA: hypothetical protein VJT31_39010, partial [Rugosimonospora sp.]|nr:hypothetical protein [Rugosimonospora sp.]